MCLECVPLATTKPPLGLSKVGPPSFEGFSKEVRKILGEFAFVGEAEAIRPSHLEVRRSIPTVSPKEPEKEGCEDCS